MNIDSSFYYDLIDIREEWGARSPGWFIAECECGSTMTGSEPSVEEWAWEHAVAHESDMIEAGFPG